MKALGVLLLLLLAAPLTAHATSTGPTLEEARSSYEQLRYDDAAATLSALLDDPAFTGEQRLDALTLKGIVEVIRGQDERAREHFRELLQLSPDASLPPGLSPKITLVFDEVKASLPPVAASAAPSSSSAAEAPAPPSAAQPGASLEEPPAPARDEGVSTLALGVAASAAILGALLVGGAGALLLLSGQPPPESSLGTVQLP